MDAGPVKLPTVFSWAAYLASSWTWCIGMWLPVILLRDFGPWSFPIFAITNVVGAMGMGLMLRRGGASARFVESHRAACHAFSFVTIAFQAFFLIWILVVSGGPTFMKIGLLAAFLMPAMIVGDGGCGSGRTRLVTALVYVGSLAAAGVWFATRSAAAFVPPPPNAAHLASLGAVCVLGFLLCPYLDLTFHKARQQLAGSAGSAAFVIGFGSLFFLMILFTYFYAQPALVSAGKLIANPTLAGLAVVLHMLAQLGLTDGLHSAALREEAPIKPSIFSAMGGGGAMILALVLFVLPIENEIIYLGFMGMYGLVFPAYVWICARRDLSAPTPTQWATFGAAVVIAGPMFYLGFIEKQYPWMAAGVGVVALGRLVTLTPGRLNSPDSAAEAAAE